MSDINPSSVVNSAIDQEALILVRQAIKDFPLKELNTALTSAFSKFGQIEYKQLANSAAKQLATDLVKSDMSGKVGPVVDLWLTTELSKEIVGPKAIRDALRVIANPKVLEFTTAEIRQVGPTLLRSVILEKGTPQAEKFVTEHIPLMVPALLVPIVKKYAEANVGSFVESELKSEISNQAPEIVSDAMLLAVVPLAEAGIQKQVIAQAGPVVEKALQISVGDIVIQVGNKVAEEQAPGIVSLVFEKSGETISEMVLGHAEANVVSIVERGLKDEVTKQSPLVVSEELASATAPLVASGIQKQVDLRVGIVVEKALQSAVGDIVARSGNKVAEEQAPGVISKMFEKSTETLSGRVIHFADIQASQQAVVVVSDGFARLNLQKHLIRSVKFQSSQQSEAVVAQVLKDVTPGIVEGDIRGEVKKQLENTVAKAILNSGETIAKTVSEDVKLVSGEHVNVAVLEEVKNSQEVVQEAIIQEVIISARKNAEHIVPEVVSEASRLQIPGIVTAVATPLAARIVQPLLEEEFRGKLGFLADEALRAYTPEKVQQRFDSLFETMLNNEVAKKRKEVIDHSEKISKRWWNRFAGVLFMHDARNYISGGGWALSTRRAVVGVLLFFFLVLIVQNVTHVPAPRLGGQGGVAGNESGKVHEKTEISGSADSSQVEKPTDLLSEKGSDTVIGKNETSLTPCINCRELGQTNNSETTESDAEDDEDVEDAEA